MPVRVPMPAKLLTATLMASLGLGLTVAGSAGGARDGAPTSPPTQPLNARVVLAGASLSHTFTPAGTSTTQSEHLSKPDDITRLGDVLFVGFQNGVGPQGEPSASGNTDSTIVAFRADGAVVGQWDVTGKADGVTADRKAHDVVVTVNEDANSSLYTIDPGAAVALRHYTYNEPLPHNGGTDAISVVDGRLLISASAPGTTGLPAPQATYPAVYATSLNPASGVATVTPLFYDEDSATVANLPAPAGPPTISLALTDPDSSELVPHHAQRFAGDFVLDSQGDQQLIFVDRAERSSTAAPHLSVLSLSQSVDDTAWPTDTGTLYATDSTNDTVVAITGHFPGGPVSVATPCGSNSAPATCPSPPTFPANYLASLNAFSGLVSPLIVTSTTPFVPQGGLVFVPNHHQGQGE